MSEIVSAIEAGRLSPGLKTNLAHKQHVKGIVKDKKRGVAIAEVVPEKQQSIATACPKCGSEMVLREAKKGKNAGNQFLGCINFPQCRAILSIS